MVEQLELLLLGKPYVRYNGSELTAEKISVKGQALLIYLAVTGHNHSRSTLAGLLWGDLPEESARANLRLALTRLRKALGKDCLYVTRLEVGLNGCRLDLHEFRQKAAADLELLCELYRGDFLEGFDVPNAAEFETWLLGVRQEVRQTAVAALAHHIETAVQNHQPVPGIRAARKLLSIEPWHEEAHRRLMLLLAAAGQRSAALTQYETCRRLLAEELAIEPTAETTALYAQILNDQITKWPGDPEIISPAPLLPRSPHLQSAPPHNLPLQLTPFIGRDAELERLLRRLQDGRYRLITLLGEGGVGKTRLALAAAEQLLSRFPDGVWFVSLAEMETAVSPVASAKETENNVAAAVAAALGLNFSGGQPLPQQLAGYLRRRTTLLILDNFELLLDAAGLVMTLLTQAPGVTILTTSREPLQLQAEFVFRLDGLALPATDDWETAANADSVRFFAERARRAGGHNLLTPNNLPRMAQLCRFVNGLPLGIELIAGWTHWLSLDAIAAGQQASLLQLETTMRDVPPRHRSLQAVFAYSWDMLSGDEQRLLAQLSVFRGGFQVDAVQAVTHALPAVLFSLINKSLVRYQAADQYHLHELLRVFAAERLAELPIDQNALRDRHAVYYLERMSQRTAVFVGAESLQALRETQAEAENLARAWQWACTRPLFDALYAAVASMSAYWNYAGLFQEGANALGSAISHVQPSATHSRLLAALFAEYAVMLYELTRLDEMEAAAKAAVHHSVQAGDAQLEANGRLRLGQFYWRRGYYEAAAVELARAAHLAQKLELVYLEGVIYRTMAVNAWRQGELDRAQEYGERSAALHSQGNHVRSLLRSQHFLAILAQNRQQHAAARAYLEPMLHASQALGDRPAEISAVSLLGQIFAYEGWYEQALEYMERERKLAEESGQQWQLASNLSNTGDLWLRLGQLSQAAACYAQALALFRQFNTRQGQSNVLAYMGLLAYWRGDYENGRLHCTEALRLAQEEKVRREQAFACIFLAHNLLGLQQWGAARKAYEMAAAAWEQLGDMARRVEAQVGLARVLLPDDAAAAYTAVYPVLAHLHGRDLVGANDPAQVYLGCYEVLTAVADPRAADYVRAGQALLAAQAARIKNPDLRRSFWENIPSHRKLLSRMQSDDAQAS